MIGEVHNVRGRRLRVAAQFRITEGKNFGKVMFTFIDLDTGETLLGMGKKISHNMSLIVKENS